MKKILAHFLVSSFILTPSLLFAQGTSNIGLQNPVAVDSITDLIVIITRVIRYLAIPFIVIMIMYAGFQYILNAYNGKPPTEAHNMLKYILIGAFILLSAELIALTIRNTINSVT